MKGLRVFVVEDEALVLLSLEDMLAELGCVLEGSALRIDDALRKATTLAFDIALLDVNVNGQRIDPVASVLESRNIPFLFLSGYGRSSLSPAFESRPLLAKPYGRAALEGALRGVMVQNTGDPAR